jgi:signal transduction histidine kinase
MLLEGFAGDLRPEQADFVRTIHEKGDQLLSLIVGILDLTKLETGTMPMRKTAVRVGSLLQEVRSTLAPNAHRKGILVTVDIAPDVPDVLGDADRLRQVFVNLGDNALKFTPAGGGVTFDARSVEGGRVEVRVTDTGAGIAARDRARVFDPFYQGEGARGHGGAGLGLSIVKRLVEAHGGTVRVEANAPSGTVFSVVVPAVTP